MNQAEQLEQHRKEIANLFPPKGGKRKSAITREEINQAVEAFKAKGGQIERLPEQAAAPLSAPDMMAFLASRIGGSEYGSNLPKLTVEVGDRFGLLVVKEIIRHPFRPKAFRAVCRCDCGAVVEKFATQLRHKRISSCGIHCPLRNRKPKSRPHDYLFASKKVRDGKISYERLAE